MRVRLLFAAVFGLLVFGTAAQAQVMPGGGRYPGGGWGGMGRQGGIRRWRPPVEIPDLGNPVRRYILQNQAELKLTQPQAARVDSVASALDSQNDTLIAAVRRALGISDTAAVGEERPHRRGDDPSGQGEDIALRDRLNALKPTIKQIQKNDDTEWKAATALLDKDQRKQADKLREEDEKAQKKARGRWRGQVGQ